MRVIDPGEGMPNYVLPGALEQEQQVALPRPSATMASDGSPPGSRGTDGRVATAGAPSDEPPEQAAWGFGYAPAAPRLSAAAALTLLPENPRGYTARQQDAVRRDLGDAIGDYPSYAPDPHAGADPLTGRLAGSFEPQRSPQLIADS